MDPQDQTPQPKAVEDFDATAATMGDGLKSEFVQLEPGTFAARWEVFRFRSGLVVVQFGSERLAVARRMRVPEDRWAFVVPLAVPGAARWNGLAFGTSELIVCAPRSEGYAFEPGGTHFAVVSMSPASMPAALANASISVACAAQSCVVRPAPRDLSVLRERLRAIESAGGVADDRAPMDERLPALLTQCLGATPTRSVRTGNSRSTIVGRAEAFFRTHVGEPVSIAQLSAVAEVSERSLRNAFYRVYSVSPKRYLRLWQLHQVHSALRAADQPDATVTGAATDCGFYELGRFAGEYKALFGEAPSQTLHKSRMRNAARGAA